MSAGDGFAPGRCHTWLYWRHGGRYQCGASPKYADKCGVHGVPPGKPFKMWRVGWYSDPSAVEFVAETASQLIDARGNRTKKVSKSGSFFPTKIEALAHLLDNARRSVESAERNLQGERDDLAEAQAAYDDELAKVAPRDR